MTAAALRMTSFEGFSPRLPEFLSELRDNNTREWFQARRGEYEALLLEPSRAFVAAMAEPLHDTLGQDIHADPKIRGSIMAINRDTRFSPDKTPYKAHLDLWFWQGDGPSRERPGYFFRLTPEALILGAGLHAFAADGALERYRRAVLDDALGPRLEQLGRTLDLGGRAYKRVPAGLPQEHPRANWLCHTGLFAETTQPLPDELYTPTFTNFCVSTFTRFKPLQQWLTDALSR